MDTQYDIQWIQHHDTVDMKNINDLSIEDEQASNSSMQDDEFLLNDEGSAVDADVDTSNIDQIAAENLIFMARDGQVTEIITTGHEAINDEYVYAPTDGTDFAVASVSPQMVTEEVITDDWVQRQGAERVEVSAEQIIGSNSQVVLDIEVPLPTVQDEYTALRPYPCDFCSRRFRKKASLMNHMVAHQNDRPNLCKLCGSRFFRRSDLISHLKAHADAPDNERSMQVDLSGFMPEDHKSQSASSDHYYEYETLLPEVNKKNRNENKSINGNSNSSSTSTTRTGRISRLKPKKDTFSLQTMEDHKNVTIHHHANETNCHEKKAASVDVELTPDIKPQTPFYPVVDDSKPFVCQQCGLAFAREKALSAHIKNHRNEAPYECDECNEMFWDKDALQDHFKTHQFEASNSEYDPDEGEVETQSDSETDPLYGEFYCNECGVSFHRQDLLKRHAQMHSQSNNVVELLDKSGQHCCNTCGETFEEALDLLAHAEIHARYPPFKCILCGESFFEEATIKRHLLSVHANVMTINSCILCGKECRDRKALIKHSWDHSREKCHSCSKCGKSFHNKARLKRHMTSHRDKSVTCNICFVEFPDKRSLSNHRHSHSTTSAGKMFPCNQCGKTFGSRSSQQIHVRIHTGEKPYGCRYCWKAFADGGTLRKHERIHTGEKPYVCSVCSRAFNQRVVLREHIRSHHSGLDAKRGTYFCTLCQEILSSSSDLVQHLIQHSDVNTAKQRKPITGPRKYKRRRKLKPHEIERMRTENSKNSENGNDSDVDITDIDMENVDDLLAMTEETGPSILNKKRSKTNNTRSVNLKHNSTTPNSLNANSSSDVAECITPDNISNTPRTRYQSTNSNSDKLWSSKLNNDESLLLNVEHTLQSLDTLVVDSARGNSKLHTTADNQAQRTQQVQLRRNDRLLENNAETTVRTRRKTQTQTQLSKTSQRPRMIHTEKYRPSNNDSNLNVPNTRDNNRQRRTIATTTTRLLVARNEATSSISNTLDLLPTKTLTIVDDYEIISPATQPPHQISSSPIHIKQEESEHQQAQSHQHQHYRQLQFQQHQQQLLQETNNGQRRRRRYLTSQSSQTSRCSDLYDAQLLLDAATLRKDCYEKFNPSIVNDLEEILRSPIKTDKIGGRLRNASECSATHFLNEQLEDEAALIKIEPNSPDFQSLFNCTPNNSNGKTPERTRTSKSRQVTPNRRYLEFETNTVSTTTTRQVSPRRPKRNVRSTTSASTSSTITRKSSQKNVIGANNNYTNATYQHNGSNNIVNDTNSSNATLVNSYDAMSTIDSAAAAVHAAEAAVANSKLQRNKCYFECEMCSMIFSDRAQLLDHVPIHI